MRPVFGEYYKVATYINGYPFKPSDWKKHGLPIVRIQNLNDPSAEFNYFDGEIDEKYIVERGDLLLSWSASLGIFVWQGCRAALNQHIFNVLPGENVDNVFLFYAIHYAIEQLKKRIHGSIMRHFKKGELDLAVTTIPPFKEQQEIASVLSTIDQMIEQTMKIIQKTRELKKGLMQTLLTQGIGHKELEYSKEFGCEIPRDWDVKEVKAVCYKPQYGYTQSASEKAIGPKFLRITDIQKGKVVWDDVPYCDCPEGVIRNYLLGSGDILFARSGATTGKSYLIKDCPRAVFGSYLIRLKAKKDVNPEYVFCFFNSSLYWHQVKRKMAGSAQGGLNATVLSNIRIPIPKTIEEQAEIARILSSVDEEIYKEMRTKELLGSLKKGLIGILLTGKVRIKVN